MDDAPPPIPPQNFPASPESLVALDVIPVATAIVAEPPFAAVNYSTPVQTFTFESTLVVRPKIVVALGLIALLIACYSGLFSAGEGVWAFGSYSSRKTARQRANWKPPQSTFVTQTYTTDPTMTVTLRADPLQLADAGVATDTLKDLLHLDNARQTELAQLLRKHGAGIFEIDSQAINPTLTPAAVQAAVLSSNPARGQDNPATFVTALGTTEIYRDHAKFTSADETLHAQTSAVNNVDSFSAASKTITTTQPSTTAVYNQLFAGGPGTATLSQFEIDRAMNEIVQVNTSIPTQAQKDTIKAEISKDSQTLVTSSQGALVSSVTGTPQQLTVNFNNGSITVDNAGKILAMPNANAANVPGFGTQQVKLWPGGWTALVVCECVASGFLAVYLFITAIFLLRGSLRSPTLLKIYAYTKIPLAIIGFIGVVVLETIDEPDPYQFALLLLFGGIALPIASLVMLRMKSVRGYFYVPEAVAVMNPA